MSREDAGRLPAMVWEDAAFSACAGRELIPQNERQDAEAVPRAPGCWIIVERRGTLHVPAAAGANRCLGFILAMLCGPIAGLASVGIPGHVMVWHSMRFWSVLTWARLRGAYPCLAAGAFSRRMTGVGARALFEGGQPTCSELEGAWPAS